MNNYNTILFDLYGTLVDIHTDEYMMSLWKAMQHFYESHGAPCTACGLKNDYFRLVTEAENNLHAAAKKDAHEAHPEIDIADIFSRLYKSCGVTNVSDELILQTALCFRKASTTHIRLYAGAAGLLNSLHSAGKQIILLSNAQRLFTVPELISLGIYDLFDKIYISSDHKCKKPDTKFFMLPINELGLNPADCLMIGNDPVCDIQGAKQVGMDAYYIHSALSPRPCPDRSFACLAPDRFQSHMNLDLVRRRILS